MTEKELRDYFEEKKSIFERPEALQVLEMRVNYFLSLDHFDPATKMVAAMNMEFLCFALHTDKGRDLYIKLLNHLGKHSDYLAQRYWDIFDNQEKLIERYNI
jgi:hypothetical protein